MACNQGDLEIPLLQLGKRLGVTKRALYHYIQCVCVVVSVMTLTLAP